MTETLKKLEKTGIYGALREESRNFFKERASSYPFTLQEWQKLFYRVRDMEVWGEDPLARIGPLFPIFSGEKREKAEVRKILEKVERHWSLLKEEGPDYRSFRGHRGTLRSEVDFRPIRDRRTILGLCPVASPKTRCCNLLTLDTVMNCGLGCSYCSIQSFYKGNKAFYHENLKEKLEQIRPDPKKRYHIGTGQASDSLLWGNRMGLLDDLTDFARRHKNMILELKTKTKKIDYFLENPVPPNIFLTWSLNTEVIAGNEEHMTASPKERISAARRAADRGILVGFHFHPLILYKGWQADYRELIRSVRENFRPEEIGFISLGTLTFTRNVLKQIRRRDFKSKILQMPLEETAGKFSYPLARKKELFSFVYRRFADWHRSVFFYLCMEPHELWEPVFGKDYPDNASFEEEKLNALFQKTAGLPANRDRERDGSNRSG